jgi:A/G-specific adenine glycosylase
LVSFSERLLAWFDIYGRHDLPWQHPNTPYRVWVSEVMLQQTQVATAIPYFERFMRVFPSVSALAAASVDAVLAQWSGLGYYARGRNLHKAAQIIMRDHAGELPRTAAQLVALPGIGLSTANAILSLSFQQPTAICDGNVRRVLARWSALPLVVESKQAEQQLWQLAQTLQSQTRPRDYTQAIMDLGATLCTRSNPDCTQCPVARDCGALASGEAVTSWPKRLPKKTRPTKTATLWLVFNKAGALWLAEPTSSTGIWGGLHQLPQSLPETLLGQDNYTLSPIKHVFTHFTLVVTAKVVLLSDDRHFHLFTNGLWYNPKDKTRLIAMPAIVDKLLAHWLQQGRSS